MTSNETVARKLATVYRRKQTLFAHASSLTTDGLWMMTEPVLKLEEGATDADIGSTVRACLDQSRTNVEHPKTFGGGLLKPLLMEAGVKSWAKFVEGTSCVVIESHNGRLSIIPTVNLGAVGGFEDQPARSLTINKNAVASEIGAAVRALLH
jgi:hypothetical protein